MWWGWAGEVGGIGAIQVKVGRFKVQMTMGKAKDKTARGRSNGAEAF